MPRKIVDESGAELAPAAPGGLVAADRSAVVDAAIALMEMVPEAVDDDGTGIIANLLAAENWEDLNSQTKLPAGKELVGETLVLRAISRRVSELEDDDEGTGIKLPHYLIIDSVRSGLGTGVRWQTSSPGLVVPIVKLYVWGKFPATVRIDQSDKPTKKGFRPLNLNVLAVNG